MKLGIALDNLGHSQLAFYAIRNINALLAEGREHEVVVFYQELATPCITPRFAAMPIQEAFGFDGPLVATSYTTAEAVRGFPSSPRKLWYAWDLDWLRLAQKDYGSLARVYRDPRLSVLARSADHAQAIEGVWLRPVAGVVPDFDLKLLLHHAH